MNLEVTNDEIKLNDGIGNYICKYDEVPNQMIPMVVESKKSLMQEIDLEDMLTNLDNSAELIYIAFCALHGKSMQSDLDGLQAALLKLCAKSKVTMTTFRDQSKDITIKILGSYKWMKKGMVDQAKIVFKSTASYAGEMANKSKELSNEFNALADRTTVVLQKVEVEHADEIKNKEEIENELQTMTAEHKKQTQLAKSLSEDLTVINVEYQEEKQKLATAEKREMTMGIVSAITGALSLGISSAVNAAKSSGGAGVNTAEINRLNTEQQNNKTQQSDINTKKERAEKKLKAYEEELIDLKNNKRIEEEKLKTNNELLLKETNEELKIKYTQENEQITKTITEFTQKITEKEKQIADTEKSLTDYSSQLSGLSEALKSITDSLNKMQEQAQKAVDQHSQKVAKLLDKKLQMEKEKRESLAEMEKFAVLIQRNNNKVITTDTAIEMLVVAIRCLKKVASSLITASMFWESLRQYCEKLSKSTIDDLLDSVKEFSKEDRIEFFTDPDFVLAIISYAAQWAAMYYVSDEYYIAANKTYQHTNENFQSMPDAVQALQIAQNRSSAILSGIASQKRESELEMIQLQKQKDSLLSKQAPIEVKS